jgi:hypothetical protein
VPDAEQLEMAIVPSSESSFMESVTQTSITLTSALEALELGGPENDQVVTSKHPAMILEKLAHSSEAEEEIPAGI